MDGLGPSFGRQEGAVFAVVLISAAVLVGAVALVAMANPASGGASARAQGLSSFDSYSELLSFVTANARSAQQYATHGVLMGGFATGIGMFPPAFKSSITFNVAQSAASASPWGGGTVSFTGTNVQVQGVDEPDRVKTDGTYLYVSSGSKVSIVNAYPPNSTSIVSVISLPNSSILGLEIAADRLLVIDQRSQYQPGVYYMTAGVAGFAVPRGGAPNSVAFLLYNTSHPASPELVANVTVPGSYVAARLSGGYLYSVVQQSAYTFTSEGNATGVLPTVIVNGKNLTLSPTSVFHTSASSQVSYYTMVVSLSMATGGQSTLSVLSGPSSTVYVSNSNIYVVYTNYPDFTSTHGILGDVYTGGAISVENVQQSQNSTILRVAYSGGAVTVAAAGVVPGSVLNQFSMDEYDGYFRVATGRFAVVAGSPTRSNDVYVLSQNMSQVSAVRNMAPGENIYAVRFVGDTGYVVTFEQIDPLFVISFKDMTNPVIESALKVTGYSDYLHPLPGGYLIGVGKDAVPSSMPNVAYYTSLKLSLFRIFDNGTSVEVSRLLIGDRGTDSPVLSDHLAFTYDPTRNVTVIPLTLFKVSGNQTTCSGCPPPYGNPVWQGVYVLKVTPQGFTLLGKVSQYPPGLNYGDSPNESLQIDRSCVIGDYLYTVSQGEVMVSDLATLSTVATVQLLG